MPPTTSNYTGQLHLCRIFDLVNSIKRHSKYRDTIHDTVSYKLNLICLFLDSEIIAVLRGLQRFLINTFNICGRIERKFVNCGTQSGWADARCGEILIYPRWWNAYLNGRRRK